MRGRARPRKARQRAPRDVQKVADGIYDAKRALSRFSGVVAMDDPALDHMEDVERYLSKANVALIRFLKAKGWKVQ